MPLLPSPTHFPRVRFCCQRFICSMQIFVCKYNSVILFLCSSFFHFIACLVLADDCTQMPLPLSCHQRQPCTHKQWGRHSQQPAASKRPFSRFFLIVGHFMAYKMVLCCHLWPSLCCFNCVHVELLQ